MHRTISKKRLHTALCTGVLSLVPCLAWAADGTPAPVLPEVSVSGQADTAPADGAAAEGYREKEATRVGPLGAMPLQDTPYSLHVTSGELIENRDAHTEGQALMVNPSVSVSVAPNVANASLSRVFIRGFNASDQSEFRDGLVDRSFTLPPIENVDRIEVLSGLSSFLYGYASLGGAINYVSKQPVADPLASLSAGLYGGGINFTQADLGGAVTADKRLRVRLNVYGEDGPTWVQDSKQKRDLVSGGFAYDLTPDTELKGNFYHQDFDLHGSQATFTPSSTASGQFIVPKAFDATKQYGQNWTFTRSEKDLGSLGLTSELNQTFSLRTAYQYSSMERYYAQIVDLIGTNGTSLTERYTNTPRQEEKTNSGYALVDAKYSTFGLNNLTTFGYTGTHMVYQRGLDNNGIGPTTGTVLGTVNVSNLQEIAIPQTVNTAAGNDVTTQRQGLDNYVIADRLTFDPQWSAIGGATYSRNVIHTWGRVGSYTLGATNTTNAALTPSAALLYKPVDSLTTYLTYMQGLTPGDVAPATSGSRTVVNANQTLASTVSDQYETGVKTTLGQMDLTAALFRIEKVNSIAQPQTATTAIWTHSGEEIHQGLEVMGTGKLTDRLSLGGGFTWTDAKVTDDPNYEGKIPVNVPERQARAYLEYAPWWRELIFSGGGNYDGRRPVDSGNTAFIPGVVTFDAGVRYETVEMGHQVSLNLNVLNLADTHYWSSATSGSLTLGGPRTVAFTGKIAW